MSMLFTHRFASRESFTRALSWLSLLGLPAGAIEANAEGSPRITVSAEPAALSGVSLLIHVVERTDPATLPVPHGAEGPTGPAADVVATPPARPSTTAIGWHPHDPAPSSEWNLA